MTKIFDRKDVGGKSHPAFSILLKFALLGGYAVELKNFLSRWSAESRMFLSRCISRSVPKTLCSVC